MQNYSNYQEDDQYLYIKERRDCIANEETITPYTKIIQSKEEFDVVKEDNKISQVSKRSLTTIIEMIQEYIEETVLWIYEDPNTYAKQDPNQLALITQYQLLKEDNNNQSQSHIIEIHSIIIFIINIHLGNINCQKLIINSNEKTTKQPGAFYALIIIYSILFVFGTILLAQFIITKDVGLLFLLII